MYQWWKYLLESSQMDFKAYIKENTWNSYVTVVN